MDFLAVAVGSRALEEKGPFARSLCMAFAGGQ